MNEIDNNFQQSYDYDIEYRKSKLGYDFCLSETKWRLDNSIVINWGLMPSNVEDECAAGIKLQMADYACELSAAGADNIFHNLLLIFRTTGDTSLKLNTVRNFLATLDPNTEWRLGAVRAFLVNWHDKQYGGIDPKLAPWLEEVTLKGRNKGVPVAKGCPHAGAYNMQEQHAIIMWGVNAFMDETISLCDYTWLMLNIYLGARPDQFRKFLACDLITNSNKGGAEYKIKVPQSKRRGVSYRDILQDSDIDEDLALLFVNQAQYTLDLIEKQVGKLPKELKSQMPVFGNAKAIKSLDSINNLKTVINKTPDALHMSRTAGTHILTILSRKCTAHSIRLDGEFIHLTARRFRYTLGTNGARRGLSGFAIAKLLGHTGIQNVSVYTQSVKELKDEVNEALAPVLAPLAQAFAGQLIKSEADAIRANDPRSRIKNNNGEGVGNCGTYGFCATGGRACYTCIKFQPWIHGKHKLVLNDLLAERSRLKDKGASKFIIQSTDVLVLAITEVAQLSEGAKAQERVLYE